MSINVYPVIPVEPTCDDYSIRINGAQVAWNTARVSAVPFNRRWPGHQRQIDQSEPIQFLSLSADEPLRFEITPRMPFDPTRVKIRPRSLGILPQVTEDGRICFTLEHPAYFTVEAYGRNRALHVFVDEPMAYDVDRESRDVIYFGAGEHDVGVIELRSNQTLFLDEGAVVYACVRAMDASHIRILGHGILDNSRNREQILFEVNAEDNSEAINNATRAHTIQLEYCDDVLIDGITIRDSLVYNIRPIGCDGLTIQNVKIIGCWRFNSDGTDMHNCLNVHIDHCFIRTFDDSICVKGFDCYYDGDVEQAVHDAMYRGGESYDVFKNVVIRDCVIWNDWGKSLEIGAETRAEEIGDILFTGCHIIHVTGPALDCANVDYADVHHITFEDISIELDETIPKSMIQTTDEHRYENIDPDFVPAMIRVEVMFHHEYSAGGGRRGKNREMRFENIRIYGRQTPRFVFRGYDAEHKTSDITVKKCYVNGKPLQPEGFVLKQNDFCENINIEL